VATVDIAIAIGGAAGQGIATPGNILARILVRRGLHVNVYDAYQSIIRGGHIFLTLRTSDAPLLSHGDKLDILVALNQDTMDRHLKLMGAGSAVLYNSDKIKPGQPGPGVQLCPFSVKELAPTVKGDLVQNTLALGAALRLMGVEFEILEEILTRQFRGKGDAVVAENVGVARAGYQHASDRFTPFPVPLPNNGGHPLAFIDGNTALAMGGAAAGVRFYCAYPMSPSSGVLHWFAGHGQQLGIMVRQVEDEIGVINMAVGAAHTGVRTMCATSGGGFALMTEALGAAAMMEIPVVCINVQRAGPATGVPTKTEQGDLWQVLGAGQGDYPRIIVAPTTVEECFHIVPELFNLVDRFQCPGIILTDLLLSEGRFSIDPAELNFDVPIERGEVIGLNGSNGHAANGPYMRYEITPSGISPRALPGTEGYVHVVATDEHDQDGVLISDEFTNPLKRQAMHEKRMRKMDGVLELLGAPTVFGPADAEVTLIGWGSTTGVIREAMEQLAAEGITANNLQVKWLVPLHADAILDVVAKAKRTIIVENNYSGQFARYLRSETSIVADGHIRKYDGEPFMPHHIVAGVKAVLAGAAKPYVPVHEIMV
jgi:2-oxoglutarate ferredoxin oxidoreductase subunit alpha